MALPAAAEVPRGLAPPQQVGDGGDALQCLRVRREITTRFIGSENSCAGSVVPSAMSTLPLVRYSPWQVAIKRCDCRRSVETHADLHAHSLLTLGANYEGWFVEEK